MMETKLSDLEGLKKKEMDYLMDYTMSGGGVSEIQVFKWYLNLEQVIWGRVCELHKDQ